MGIKRVINELKILRDELKPVSIKEIPNPKNGFLSIANYQVILKSGEIFNRQKLVKKEGKGDAVVIVPITDTNETFVIVQPRVFTKMGVGVEIPSGYIDEGEEPIDAARRELREEIGVVADELIPLKSFYQDQGISGAYNTCFLALNCRQEYTQKLDKDEYIKFLKIKYSELLELVDAGIINDVNGIIAISEAKKRLSKMNRS